MTPVSTLCAYASSVVFCVFDNTIPTCCGCGCFLCVFSDVPLEYVLVDVYSGDTLRLACNTSADGGMWTYDNDDDGYVDYVYWNGRVDGGRPRLSVNVTANDVHSLVISPLDFNDDGLYDCYNIRGTRLVGYQLTVHGMYCNIG